MVHLNKLPYKIWPGADFFWSQIWSRFAAAAAMDFPNDSHTHHSSHITHHTSPVIFYVMSGILLRGSNPLLLPNARKHVAVCVESTIYEIGMFRINYVRFVLNLCCGVLLQSSSMLSAHIITPSPLSLLVSPCHHVPRMPCYMERSCFHRLIWLRCDSQSSIWPPSLIFFNTGLSFCLSLPQVFADRYPEKSLLIPVGGSSLAYRWWLYKPLQQQQKEENQKQEQLKISKLNLISAISSTKNETQGHVFRLETVKYLEQQQHVHVDVFGWGRRPARDIGGTVVVVVIVVMVVVVVVEVGNALHQAMPYAAICSL